jgi:hypothetical protein
MLEQQSGQNSVYSAQALAGAEAGLSEIVSTTDAAAVESLPVGGGPVQLGSISLADRIVVSTQITRLTPTLVLIRATGEKQNADGIGLASRTLGLIARVGPAPAAGDSVLSSTGISPVAERAWIQQY